MKGVHISYSPECLSLLIMPATLNEVRDLKSLVACIEVNRQEETHKGVALREDGQIREAVVSQ